MNHFTSALDLAIEAGISPLLHTCRLSRLIAVEELKKLLDMDGTDFKLERFFRFPGRESYALRAGIERGHGREKKDGTNHLRSVTCLFL